MFFLAKFFIRLRYGPEGVEKYDKLGARQKTRPRPKPQKLTRIIWTPLLTPYRIKGLRLLIHILTRYTGQKN